MGQTHCLCANSPNRPGIGHLVALYDRNVDAVAHSCEGPADSCYRASRREWVRREGVVTAATRAGKETAMVRCPAGLEAGDAREVEAAPVGGAVAKTFAGAHRSDGGAS